ncbi:MAG: hypothetical protein MI867_06090 [Pseudomonadales bacterium]|nr:hypothetical protein [Pseudomonadales bacterium]
MKKYLLILALLFVISGCVEVEHRLEFQELRVADRNEAKGGGDEVMLGVIYYTGQFGVTGSSAVHVKPVRKLHSNVATGGELWREHTAVFDFSWATFQQGRSGAAQAKVKSYSQTGPEFISSTNGPSVEGAILIAVEQDLVGDRFLNNKFNTAINRVTRALQLYIEDPAYADSAGNRQARFAYVEEKLGCFQEYAKSGRDCYAPGGLAGGGGLNGKFFDALFGNIGHDLIGIANVLYFGVEDPIVIGSVADGAKTDVFRNNRLERNQPASCGRDGVIAELHVCGFTRIGDRPVNANLNFLFYGEGARWTLRAKHLTRVLN